MRLLLIIIFLFVRFYHIDKSLYFYNDMGRDYQVLYNWAENNEMPFLGPQSSALPINQSPIYFYFLMPFYLIFNASPYASLIACSALYIIVFLISLQLTKSEPALKKTVLITFFLIALHPQSILQNRFIWNPSLLSPVLFLSLILFLLYFKKNHKKYLFSSIFFINLAISLNYSVTPLLFAYIFIFILNKRKNILDLIKYFSITFICLNLPAIVQVFKRFLINGSFFNQNQIFQTGSPINQKVVEYINYVFGINNILLGILLLIFIILFSLFYSYFSKNIIIKISAQIFIGTFLLTLFIPFNLQAHYIFALLISFFIFLSLLDLKIKLAIIALLLFFYVQPRQINSYFKDSPRTYNQMNECFKNFCSRFNQPIFVSVQSDLYPYHYGPEHRYLMTKNGCQVRSIEENKQSADNMAVVLDSGSFSEQTHYYELDLFGKNKIDFQMDCQPNFKIILLSRFDSSSPVMK